MFERAALAYARMGWFVFPLAAGSKVPAIRGGRGVHDATTDAAVIVRWARDYPTANVGIACGKPSRIVVIDIDPRNGADRTMVALTSNGHIWASCPCARTGSGGRHYYYEWHDGIGNSKGRFGPGIDVKSTGGYVVAPPSVLDNGGSYQWITRPGPPPPLPRWAMQRLIPPRRIVQPTAIAPTDQSFGRVIKFLGASPSGERNNRLYWASCRARELVNAHQLSQSGAIDQLLTQAVAIGLPHGEALATIRSAFVRVE